MTEYKGPGKKPEMKWLPKDSFVVDYHYQRKIDSNRSQKVIEKISKNFLWSRFQPPTVTPGPRGKYLVIDGQHRIAGAVACTHIQTIPCYVVFDLDRDAQAESFVAINTDRVRLHPLTIHYALVSMGDSSSMKIQEVCEEAGVAICRNPAQNGMTHPKETAAIGTIKSGIRIYGEANVIAALMIVADSFKMTPGMMRSRILKVMMRFFKKHGVKNIDRRSLMMVLKEHDPVDLETKALIKSRKGGGNVEALMLEMVEYYYAKVMRG